MATVTPRALRAEEQQTLDFLLASPLPGMDEQDARCPACVVGDCDCGCATIGLLPDKDHVPRSVTEFSRVAVAASSRERQPTRPNCCCTSFTAGSPNLRSWTTGVTTGRAGSLIWIHGRHQATTPWFSSSQSEMRGDDGVETFPLLRRLSENEWPGSSAAPAPLRR